MYDPGISLALNIAMPSAPSRKESLNSYQSANIGGLGDIRLNAIRFKEYSLDIRDDGCWLVPSFDPEDTDGWFDETEITGNELLVSLMNLYEAINKPGVSEGPASKLVAHWCSRNIHPYAHQVLLDEIKIEKMTNRADAEDDPDDAYNDDPDDDLQNQAMEQLLQKSASKSIDAEAIFRGRMERRGAFSLQDFLNDLHSLISAFTTYLAVSDDNVQ